MLGICFFRVHNTTTNIINYYKLPSFWMSNFEITRIISITGFLCRFYIFDSLSSTLQQERQISSLAPSRPQVEFLVTSLLSTMANTMPHNCRSYRIVGTTAAPIHRGHKQRFWILNLFSCICYCLTDLRKWRQYF